MTTAEILQQSIDKQRILVIGGGNDLITSIIVHALNFKNRKFDLVRSGTVISIQPDTSLILFDNGTQPTDYKHHIIVFGNSTSGVILSELETLADATPKAGTIIFPKSVTDLNKIGSKERADTQAIPYETYKHEQVKGKTVLISSTKERIPIELSDEMDLLCVSAAKELLKKIGISSSDFYKAISTFKPA